MDNVFIGVDRNPRSPYVKCAKYELERNLQFVQTTFCFILIFGQVSTPPIVPPLRTCNVCKFNAAVLTDLLVRFLLLFALNRKKGSATKTHCARNYILTCVCCNLLQLNIYMFVQYCADNLTWIYEDNFVLILIKQWRLDIQSFDKCGYHKIISSDSISVETMRSTVEHESVWWDFLVAWPKILIAQRSKSAYLTVLKYNLKISEGLLSNPIENLWHNGSFCPYAKEEAFIKDWDRYVWPNNEAIYFWFLLQRAKRIVQRLHQNM